MKKNKKKSDIDMCQLMPYIVHQLKTPLTSISGFADILQHTAENKLSGKENEYLQNIVSNSVNLLDMLNGISDFSKLESGDYPVNAHHFSLQDAIENVVHGAASMADEKKIAINITGSDVQAYADYGLLYKALNAIIDNAVKNTSPGGRITVTLDEINDFTIITVSDDGYGIDKESGKHIFDVPYQIKHHNSNRGIGLGLAIAKRSIELLGGSILIDSKQGAGTNVTLRLLHKQTSLSQS